MRPLLPALEPGCLISQNSVTELLEHKRELHLDCRPSQLMIPPVLTPQRTPNLPSILMDLAHHHLNKAQLLPPVGISDPFQDRGAHSPTHGSMDAEGTEALSFLNAGPQEAALPKGHIQRRINAGPLCPSSGHAEGPSTRLPMESAQARQLDSPSLLPLLPNRTCSPKHPHQLTPTCKSQPGLSPGLSPHPHYRAAQPRRFTKMPGTTVLTLTAVPRGDKVRIAPPHPPPISSLP